MMYTMPKNLLSICVNFALATQLRLEDVKKICPRASLYFDKSLLCGV